MFSCSYDSVFGRFGVVVRSFATEERSFGGPVQDSVASFVIGFVFVACCEGVQFCVVGVVIVWGCYG